ncbi:MAG: hypothetical protein WKF94_11955 [Solirubrobacteraceae bacterium]
MAVIYGRKPVKAFVAVARQCTDPVQSKEDPALWFAWFQVQPLGRDVGLSMAQGRRGLSDWGVLRSLQGVPKLIPEERRSALYGLLAGRDDAVKARIAAWRGGGGRYPAPDLIPVSELRRSWWDREEVEGLPDDHERRLSEAIAERLVKSRRGRWFKDADGLSGRCLEHFLQLEDGRRGFADIVLVSREHSNRTLLLVEVKKRAEPMPFRNPVPQVLQYRKALEESEPRWRVKPMVVATEYSPAVLNLARSLRIEAVRFDPERNRLTQA